MSTPITEYVTVTVDVQDRVVQKQGFGIMIIVGLFAEPSAWGSGDRTASYANLTALAVDFATTTKVYKAAAAVFGGDPAPKTLKVGRVDSGDSNITDGLTAIEAFDADWYGLVSTYRVEADLNEIAAWVASAAGTHIVAFASEDSGIIDSGDDTDIASDLQTASYNRATLLYSHEGGIDHPSGNAINVSSGIATVTKTLHTFRVGDLITVAGAVDFGSSATSLVGNFTVATVPTDGTYTYLAPLAADGAATGTIIIFGRYLFSEARWMGRQLPSQPGEEDWAFKALTGQNTTPLSLMSLSQQQAVRAKDANVYTTIGGQGATQVGTMASGRFIDTQIGIDWLEARIGEAIMTRRLNSPKIPYTQAGINSLIGDIVDVLEQGFVNTLLGPLVNSVSGERWIITMPQLEDISTDDKINRNLPAAEVTVQLAGAIITFNVNVAALI